MLIVRFGGLASAVPGMALQTLIERRAAAADAPRPRSVLELRTAASAVLARPATSAGRDLGRLVRVWAGSSGGGASTMALALSDAADKQGTGVRLLDAASPAWSGLAGCSAHELGSADGWRRGRRGRSILVERFVDEARNPEEVSSPPPRDADLTILDVGWLFREVASATDARGSGWLSVASALVDIVVASANEAALARADQVIARLETIDPDSHKLLVVVGSPRRASSLRAALGPRVGRLFEDGEVLFAPVVSPKALPGLGPEPLPKKLRAFGVRLLDHILEPASRRAER